MKRDQELCKLILLQVRDGTPPKELAEYEEPLVVYNAALLIEGGFIDGEALRGGDGSFVSVVMLQLTNEGHDLLEKLQAEREQHKTETSDPMPTTLLLKIFISHSAKDETVAAALVALLSNALNLPANAIRCTSVNGYRLPAGVDTEERLRQEVHQAKAFIGLITPSSIASAYVMFELGARWGAKLHLVPLLAAGAGSESLRGPLGSLNALNCEDSAQVHQLISDLATLLEISDHNSPAVYQKLVEDLVQCSKAAASYDSKAAKGSQVSENTKLTTSELPEEELNILRLFVGAGDNKLLKDSVAERTKTHPLKADQLLDRLVSRKLLYEGLRMGMPSYFYLTSEGRDFLVNNNLI